MTDAISASLETHTDNLKVLCRICGGKLKKTKELYESSYAVVDFREWLLKNFGLNTEKDDSQIHPQRFCNLCYVSSGESGSESRVTRQPIAWEAHSEDNCTACSTLRLLQKGGRPKKSKRGRPASQKKESTGDATKQSEVRVVADFIKKIVDIKKVSTEKPKYQITQLAERFEFVESVRPDFYCPICKELLSVPIETSCEHYFCAECLIGVFESCDVASCPLCKAQLDGLTGKRLLVRLVSEIQVQCKVCKLQLNYEHCIEHAASCSLHPIPHSTQSDETVTSTTVEAALEDLKQGKSSASVDRLCILWMKSQLRSSEDGKTVQLKTGGRVSVHCSISQAKLFR